MRPTSSASGSWSPWRRHRLFVIALFLISPICGYALAEDRGLLLGLAVGVIGSAWLLWSRHERESER